MSVLQPVYASEEEKHVKQSETEILTAWLKAYAMSFPEIYFILLSGGGSGESIKNIYGSLGDGASNVDYEHPVQAGELLMEAQFDRIRLMLKESMPSATLFKIGKDSALIRPYACVLTLNEKVFAGDPLASTRFIFGAEQDSEVNFLRILDNQTFLLFTFHHEVFHCLDAYINGPTRPMTTR